MTCYFLTPAHTGRDILPVRIGLRKDVQICCLGCREHIAEMAFLRVVDRRVTDLPVISERRGFRPRWLSNLAAKDFTGRVA